MPRLAYRDDREDSRASNVISIRKLALLSELWEDLASNPEDIPITLEQIAEVDRQLEEYRQNPNLGSSWEELKARILGQKR